MLYMTPKGNVGFERSIITTDEASQAFLLEETEETSHPSTYDDPYNFDYPFAIGDVDSLVNTNIQLEESDAKRIRVSVLPGS